MANKVSFLEGSLDDYFEGISYYENISKELADTFNKYFWNIINKVKENPLQYQLRYKNVRIAFTQNFPFGVHFIVQLNQIYILRILHTSRFFK